VADLQEQDMFHLILTKIEAEELCDLTTIGAGVVLRKGDKVPEVMLHMASMLCVQRIIARKIKNPDSRSICLKLAALAQELHVCD